MSTYDGAGALSRDDCGGAAGGAHRFVIGRQRRSRGQALLASELESLDGVGPKTARLLWDAFGSLDAMRAADLDALRTIPGLGKTRAARILTALRTLGGGAGGAGLTQGGAGQRRRKPSF